MPAGYPAGCSAPTHPRAWPPPEPLETRSGPLCARGPPCGATAVSDDWLVYKHWDSGRGGYGTISDFYGYNGNEPRELNPIKDVGLEARITVSQDVETISIAVRSGNDRFVVRIPAHGRGEAELLRNNQPVRVVNRFNPFSENGLWPRTVLLEAAVMDGRVQAAVDGKLLFEPYDYDDPTLRDAKCESPVALGVRGGAAEVSEFRVYRDIYYTGSLANIPRRPHGSRSAVVLGADDFFVLGDNSPVSNDSRFWSEGPVVRGSMFVGKPFLVHLPGQVVPLKVFGRSVCWVPDPRRIRYIR